MNIELLKTHILDVLKTRVKHVNKNEGSPYNMGRNAMVDFVHQEIERFKNEKLGKEVKSYNVEFGYELLSALPYAYALYQNGFLSGTESAIDTESLYYFSPEHKINPTTRSWDNMNMAWADKLPNIKIHRPDLDWDMWSPPPLKEKYKNSTFVFKKPILCICNRVNVEWGKEAINYLNVNVLEQLFDLLSPFYHIIYFNIEGRKEFYDEVEPISIGDFDLAKQKKITTIHDLHKKHPELSFNTLQLMVMANAEAFITMNGGYSILASYMGGTNIIYSKECREIKPEINSFNRWYHKLGGSRIVHTDNYDDLLHWAKTIWTDKKPLVNVLTRTHNRPNFFKTSYESVINQTYKNIRLWVGHDNEEANKYIIPYKCTPIKVSQLKHQPTKPAGNEYGVYFPFNNYWNQLKNQVQEGWVIAVDDDDQFVSEAAVEEIMNCVTSEDDLLLWKVAFGDITIPSEQNFGKEIVVKDISGIGFCCHIKHIKEYEIEPFRRADYRIVKHLFDKLNPVWIDKVLTKSQHGGWGMGNGQDKKPI